MADPGLPQGGGANSPGEGAPTYDFAKFSRKLHEIERILTSGGWGEGGGRAPRAPSNVSACGKLYSQIKFSGGSGIFRMGGCAPNYMRIETGTIG